MCNVVQQSVWSQSTCRTMLCFAMVSCNEFWYAVLSGTTKFETARQKFSADYRVPSNPNYKSNPFGAYDDCTKPTTARYLWCVVHGMNCLAAAPTGIAAANIEVDGTDICAATLHSVFDFDGKYESKLDFTKPTDKVAAILRMKAVFCLCKFVRVARRQFRLRVFYPMWFSVVLARANTQVLFLDEAPQPERATTYVRMRT
jgi:hypothetical protein